MRRHVRDLGAGSRPAWPWLRREPDETGEVCGRGSPGSPVRPAGIFREGSAAQEAERYGVGVRRAGLRPRSAASNSAAGRLGAPPRTAAAWTRSSPVHRQRARSRGRPFPLGGVSARRRSGPGSAPRRPHRWRGARRRLAFGGRGARRGSGRGWRFSRGGPASQGVEAAERVQFSGPPPPEEPGEQLGGCAVPGPGWAWSPPSPASGAEARLPLRQGPPRMRGAARRGRTQRTAAVPGSRVRPVCRAR